MDATRNRPLDERIKQIRVEIDAVIDAHVETIAKHSPGVPLEVVRSLLTARAPACRCAQYLDISREGKV